MVAAIGEQILGPTDVSLSNWTVRPSSGCSVVLATHTAGVSVDGYTLTLAANPWNIVRTYGLTPGRELLFACRYRLGTASNFVVYMSEADNVYDPLYGSFAGDEGAWSTAKMYFTVPPNGVAKLHFGAHFQAPGLPNQTAGTVDVYGLEPLMWIVENPAAEDPAVHGTPALGGRDLLQDGTPYRKQTRLWTNMRWRPRRSLCRPGSRCEAWQDGRHLRAAQRGPRLMEGQYERVSQSRELLYSVPAALCEEIARAATEELAEASSGKCQFFHVFACFFGRKNEEEGHPRLFSRFFGALKSGATKHQKW